MKPRDIASLHYVFRTAELSFNSTLPHKDDVMGKHRRDLLRGMAVLRNIFEDAAVDASTITLQHYVTLLGHARDLKDSDKERVIKCALGQDEGDKTAAIQQCVEYWNRTYCFK